MTEFFRFPHTPHIAWLSEGSPRDDKVLAKSEVAQLLGGDVVVEEKVDGANLGFAIGESGEVFAQNRRQYLIPPFHGQFSPLGKWLDVHQVRLFDALNESLIVFGEWCTARHSLRYDELPGWWLMFDVYDREAQRFWNTERRNELATNLGVPLVPQLYRGRVSIGQLTKEVGSANSRFRSGNVEGLVVRKDGALWLEGRAKLVRPGFTQEIGKHWRSRPLEWNAVIQSND